MKRTANKFQRAYMVAKARVQEVESQQEAIEKKFIADKGIVNPDGSVPEFLYCMEDDAAFEKANDECAALIVSAGLEEELNAARSVLKASEDSLIAYGLSLAPAGVRATLEKAVQHNAATRAKVLDLAFRLDVSTVSRRPSCGRMCWLFMKKIVDCYIYRGEWILPFESGWFLESESCSGKVGGIPIYRALSDAKNAIRKRLDGTQTAEPRIIGTAGWNETSQQYFIEKREKKPAGE